MVGAVGGLPPQEIDESAAAAETHRVAYAFSQMVRCMVLRLDVYPYMRNPPENHLTGVSASNCRTARTAGRDPGARMAHDDITQLLLQWKGGNESGLRRLLPLVYRELHGLARSCLRRDRRPDALQPTELVHELFIRMSGHGVADWRDRSHFFGIAARAMRQILVEQARHQRALKRGGMLEAAEPVDPHDPSLRDPDEVIAIATALSQLAQHDPAQARVVELRYFCGFTIDETADILNCSPATVSREWQLARVWLYRALRGGPDDA